jgi:ABC-2 type transport system permease protein
MSTVHFTDPAVTTTRPSFAPLLRTQARLFRREPVGLLWGLVAPVVIFVIIGVVPGTTKPTHALGGVSVEATYLPILVAFAIAMIGLNGLPPVFATYREKGILRRLSTTPASPTALLAAELVIDGTVCVIGTVILLIVGRTAFGVGLPGQAAGFVVAGVLTAVAIFGLGLTIAALAPSAKAANAIGALLFFPLNFFAGLWIPRESMGSTLRTISDYTPLGAGVRALQDSMQGQWMPLSAGMVLVVWGIAFGLVATRAFRWE